MILFTCSSTTYLLTGEYIESLTYQFKKRNIPVEIHKDAGKTNIKDYIITNQIKNSLVIFIQYGPVILSPKQNNKISYLNMDQILELEYRKFSVFDKLSKINCPIIDYSMENINIISKHFPKKKTYFLPYMFNPGDNIFLPECTYEYDVATVCSPSPHRMFIINELRKNGIKINHIKSKYGLDRDKEICKCKIFLNLHYVKESNILESIRCYPILFRKIVLISEESIYESDVELNNMIIYESHDNLVSRIEDILKNYNIYKEKLDKFDMSSQFNRFETNIDKFIMNEYIK